MEIVIWEASYFRRENNIQTEKASLRKLSMETHNESHKWKP